ncbi:MAG TPA: acyl-CoA dehydrogenase family protein [Polyangiales bacterium]|nr:acyl-CoA dehydrogenase family protein [Polyangiales bacterium]
MPAHDTSARDDLRTSEAPVAAARSSAAFFSAQSVTHEREGRLCDGAVDALKTANLFGLMTPRELGGLEASPRETLETFAEVSRADGSTGWVLTTCAFAAGLAGVYLSDHAVSRIFSRGVPIVAGAGAPNGRAQKQPHGFELSGRWSYGSGIRHASYTHNGGFIVDERGELRKDLGHHIFVTPIDAATLDDEWNVIGLRGTGSVDYAIDRCQLPQGFEHPTSGAVQRRGGPLYAIGMAGMSAIAHTGFFLGIGRRVLDELVDVACVKPGGRSGALADSESFQEGYGLAEAQYRAARALVFESWRTIEERVAADRQVERAHITAVHLAMYQMAWASTAAGEYAYKAAGGVSLREGPLQRAFRDVLAGRQHIRVSTSVLRACARDLLTKSA